MTAERIFPWKLFRKFVLGQLLFTLVAMAILGFGARRAFRSWFFEQTSIQSQATLASLSQDLEGDLSGWCASHSGGRFSFSVVDASSAGGSVLCSTITVEEPFGDEDVTQAIEKGHGSALKRDAESQILFLYTSFYVPARKVVLRSVVSLDSLTSALKVYDQSFVSMSVLLALVFLAYSFWVGRGIIAPLGRLLAKARQVLARNASTSKWSQDETKFDATDDAPGEWSELETALDEIRKRFSYRSERLEREREEVSTLMSAISDAVFAIGEDGTPLFYNSRFVVLFGDKELLQQRRRLAEVVRVPEILDAYERTLRGEVVALKALKLTPKGSSVTHYFHISISPLRRADGSLYGAVGIFHDVTELKKAEQIRIDFVANVSHELRTPLTAIKGYTDTLRSDLALSKMESVPKYLTVIQKNVDRLMALISDLLDLSSIESATAEPVLKEWVDVKELTTRIFAQLEGFREQRGHELVAEFHAERVLAEPKRVEQVMTNLVENAMKYVPDGGRIKVLWQEQSHSVFLKVSDNGPGIHQEHQSRLFERFYRVDKARTRDSKKDIGGTGLGLAIVKHIMQAHNGQVEVVSTPGAGAEFTCRFPSA